MKPYPLQFKPVLKQTIWGGRLLGDRLGKPIGPESNYAESWEVVDHGTDQSIVTNGPLAGETLANVIATHPQWLLGRDQREMAFPLLLKYLDCNRVLSVQVHPSDQYGLQMEKPDLGKTEAWYIVAAKPDSLIYSGLRDGVDQSMLREAIEAGKTEQVLHAFHPSEGDVVFIPAGTVHALGAGLLVAEIQQSSDTTFRLFDWNRVDSDGRRRPLHLEQGLEVADYDSGPVHPRRCDPHSAGWQSIVECNKFLLRIMLAGQDVIAGDGKFHIVTVPRGQATLHSDGVVTRLTTGATALLPAASSPCEVSVTAGGTLMGMCLPE